MHLSSLKNVVYILQKFALTTKLCGGSCVADENIIFPETCVSREYNDMLCTFPKKKTDIKLNTLKCSYNRLIMTIDHPLLHEGARTTISIPLS